MTKPTIDDAIKAYIDLRDELAHLREAHKVEEAVVKGKLAKFEEFFLTYLNSVGGKNIATEHGTVYKSKTTSATVADWDLCLGFIREQGLWHALDRRVSKKAVEEFMEAEKSPFPGVNFTVFESVNVRRS